MPTGPAGEITGNRIPALPALPAGYYRVEVTSQDAGGRTVASSLEFDVSAPAALGWNYHSDVQLTLKPDRKSYAPGDAAQILVEAPFSGTAYVSVERDKVLRSFTTHLEGNAPSIRVLLEPGDVPNVFVSVTLLRGADACPRKIKEPDYRQGSCELAVADAHTRLAVMVASGMTNYLPGQPVEVTVQVADAAGKPVSGAEVVLYAVDDGILHLTGYELPDPHSFFYATRPLAVETSISLPNLLAEDPAELRFENKGYLGGGGGRDRVRNNFLACAYWNATLTTDAQGRVTGSFAAPDSLTRYRIFAVAHTANSHFGSGQSAFQVSKPLVIEPALPAFANITDRLIARSLVQNQTARGGDVEVSLELDSRATAHDPGRTLTQRVPVPARGSAVVEFPVELTDTGTAKWIWKARFADPAADKFTDAVQSLLEVGHVVPMLREVLLGHATESQTNLLARANPLLLAGQGTITVNIANTRLNDLREAASHLLHYPYGCAEQTGSSLLPWIVLGDSPSLLPLLQRGTNDVERAIRAGVARLFSMQTKSGGLGYWPRARDPMLWASAYGGMVLALAQRHGYEVPKEEFASLLSYLQQQLRLAGFDDAGLADCCLGLYALALAGRAEPAYHEKLYSLRGKLGNEDRALLALAIAESQGPAQMIGELLQPEPTSQRKADARFGCPAREEAIRLLAWINHRPDDVLVERLVNDLMQEQQLADWGTTQGDAWALLALTEYARRVEGKSQPVEGRLKVGEQTVAFRLDGRTNVFTHTMAITNLAGAALALFNSTSNRLYTSVLIEARPPANQQPRQDRGFALQRSYERLDDENHPQDLRGLRVGDRVLVTLTLSVHETARYVAIDDALPSILEAVNSEFKTQAAGPATPAPGSGTEWMSSFREIRKDRCLYFADRVVPGTYTLRYVARVRAAGTVTAPPAKVEEMYHPERYGLSGTQTVSSQVAQ
jgi:alpha-2-macroglobulin